MVVKQKRLPGPHHKHTKSYVKVYWPYMPLIIIVAIGIFIGLSNRNISSKGTLAYSTNVSNSGLIQATNKQRSNNNETLLSKNDQLAQAAQAKADDMAKRDYWSHNTPEGNAPWSFITTSGYSYDKVGENLAYGFATSEDVVSGWMNSPTHKANLLDPAYVDVGFGFANSSSFQNSGESTVVVAMYGRPLALSSTKDSSGNSIVSAETLAFNSKSEANNTPKAQKVSRIEAMTQGNLPWIQLFVGVAIGVLITMLAIKHGIRIKRTLKDGEQFVIHHPILDVTVIALVILLIILSQQVGIIL